MTPMKRKPMLLAAMLAVSLSACSQSEQQTAEPPSNLDINSAKRQCSTTASMAMIGQGVPEEAIDKMCDCSIDRLVETGDFTAGGQPDDDAMEGAMTDCLDKLEAELLLSAVSAAPEAGAAE